MAGLYLTSRSAVSHHSVVRPYRISITSPSHSPAPATTRISAPPVLSKPRRPNNHIADAARIFSALLKAHENAPPVQRPIIVRDVSPRAWEVFRDNYGEHSAFSATKWDYENMKIIAVPLPTPFHDLAPNIMNEHIHYELRDAGIDTRARVMSLTINRENMAKNSASGISGREPDCALWTRQYHRGVVPTIVWEVGHSQKRSSLFRRAKMWCRRYDGQVCVVILLKYLRRNPLTDNSSILEVYRPTRRIADGKWTATKDGPTYTLFPPPLNANSPLDAVPLTYQDYFGPGNVGPAPDIDVNRRFDLPLSLVRRWVEEMVAVTAERFAYRYVSGGSSVAGQILDPAVAGDPEPHVQRGEVQDEGRATPEQLDYEEFGEEWDAAMSDVSDDMGV